MTQLNTLHILNIKTYKYLNITRLKTIKVKETVTVAKGDVVAEIE